MWKWFFFLLFCAYALAEAATMLAVGERIGVGWTLAEILLSAVGGALLVRVGGLYTLIRIHRRLREQELPTGELLEMLLVLVGGVLLVLPGLLSDALGLLLQMRPVRWLLRAVLRTVFGDPFAQTTIVRPGPNEGPQPQNRPGPTSGPMADEVIEVQRQD